MRKLPSENHHEPLGPNVRLQPGATGGPDGLDRRRPILRPGHLGELPINVSSSSPR